MEVKGHLYLAVLPTNKKIKILSLHAQWSIAIKFHGQNSLKSERLDSAWDRFKANKMDDEGEAAVAVHKYWVYNYLRFRRASRASSSDLRIHRHPSLLDKAQHLAHVR
jgi:hypothetical protein